jgi:murein DD-endopeptidase MepM/ murein hydrolase activator NlpD
MTGLLKFHSGIDLISEEGVPVMSAEGGMVLDSHYDSAYGNFIAIEHSGQYTTSYSHLRDRSVKQGEKINKGQTIGSVGHTGLSVGSHLHYEVLKNGKAVDPGVYLSNKK